MHYINRLYKWAKEPWPLHGFPIMMCLHISLLQTLPNHKPQINAYCSAAFQLIGGLMVLYSISSNMNLLSEITLKTSIIDWIKRFPLKRKSHVAIIADTLHLHTSMNGEVKVTHNLTSVEEKIAHLFQEINRIDSKLETTKKFFQQELQNNVAKNDKNHRELQNEVQEIGAKLKETIVGGIKLELLGVFTISYGILIPLLHL